MSSAALLALIQTHPSWPSVDDSTLADWCNEEVFNADKTELPNEKILAVILDNRAEFSALSAGDQQIVRDILYIGDSVPTEAGQPARDTLVSIFGAGSNTISSLATAISYPISRAENAGVFKTITAGEIQSLRN